MPDSTDIAPPKTTKIVQNHLLDYCQNTSLHGIKYLGERHRPRTERLLWLGALLLSIAVCAWQVNLVWIKWDTTPVVMTSEKTPTPVWTVPFPAITVCSQIKTRPNIFNFTSTMTRSYYTYPLNVTDEEQIHLNDICLVCSRLNCGSGRESIANEDSVTFLLQAAPPQNEVVWLSIWLVEEKLYGKDMFTPILTEEGVCYTFNTLGLRELLTDEAVQSDHRYLNSTQLPKSEWTQAEGYDPAAQLSTHPRRAMIGPEEQSGLTIMMIAKKDDLDYVCTETEQGFKVYIHNPAELPQARHHHVIHVDLNKKVDISVIPRLTTTSDLVQRYTPQQRQCFYPSEKKLRFFGAYTQANCEMECLVNLTLSACGCVPFYMPRNKNMTICSLEKRQTCVNAYPTAKQLLAFGRRFSFSTRKTKVDNWVNKKLMTIPKKSIECECLPSCTSLDYTVVSSTTRDYEGRELIKALQNVHGTIGLPTGQNETIYVTKLDIRINDIEFVATQRTEMFGTTDFFANCGGLLGLCMGFSVLSLVELIYFCTISLCNRFRREEVDDINITIDP